MFFDILDNKYIKGAPVVELVDTADLGSVAKALWVRVPLGARSCEGQILDQRTTSSFINCTIRWSKVKQLNFWGHSSVG